MLEVRRSFREERCRTAGQRAQIRHQRLFFEREESQPRGSQSQPYLFDLRGACFLSDLPTVNNNKKRPCTQDQFVTVGDDGTVRVWSNGDKKIVRAFNIG